MQHTFLPLAGLVSVAMGWSLWFPPGSGPVASAQAQTSEEQAADPRVTSIVAYFNRDTTTDRPLTLAIHRVQPGDSLASIAELYYGDASLARPIVTANAFALTMDHHIKVGQSLRIPEL